MSASLDKPLREGLTQVEALKPGAGFFELLAGARGTAAGIEAYARGEAGWHLAPSVSAFAFGEAALASQTGPSWQAGVAVKGTF